MARVAALAASLLAFGALAWVAGQPGPSPLDASATSWLHGLATPTLDTVMRAVTSLGSTLVVVALLALAVAGFLLRGHRREAVLLAVAMAGSVALSQSLKVIVGRPRPQLPWASLQSDFSFPSGHAMNALVFYGALALILWSFRGRRAGGIAVIGAGGLAVLVGVSRVYLGFHYLTDVAGGILAGAAWLLAVTWAIEGRQRRRAVPRTQ